MSSKLAEFIKIVFFSVNFLFFIVFGACLAGGFYVLVNGEETILGQNIEPSFSVNDPSSVNFFFAIIILILFSFLCLFTCFGWSGSMLKSTCLLKNFIVILFLMFGVSVGGIIVLHVQFGENGSTLVLQQFMSKSAVAYKEDNKEDNILTSTFWNWLQETPHIVLYAHIALYGIPVIMFFSLVMGVFILDQVNSSDQMTNETRDLQGYDGPYNGPDIDHDEDDSFPYNPYYQQIIFESNAPNLSRAGSRFNRTGRSLIRTGNSFTQTGRIVNQTGNTLNHTSTVSQEDETEGPPSYEDLYAGVVMSIQSYINNLPTNSQGSNQNTASSNSSHQASNSIPTVSNSLPTVSNPLPEISNSLPTISNSMPWV